MDNEQVIAGMRCRDVLALLADAVDGTLEADVGVAVKAHVAACDRCARFGTKYAALVETLRGTKPAPVDNARTDRVKSRVRSLMDVVAVEENDDEGERRR